MTVPTDLVKQFANGNGVTTIFYFTYALVLPTDLEVYVNQTLIDTSLYTVAINTNGIGGSVTFGTAPTSGVNNVLLYRFVNYLQETHFPNESDFNQVTLEDSVDKLTMECQQLEEGLSRSFQWSLTDPGIPDLELPPYAPGEVIGWDPNSRKLADFSLPTGIVGATGPSGPAGPTGATGPSGSGGAPEVVTVTGSPSFNGTYQTVRSQIAPRAVADGDILIGNVALGSTTAGALHWSVVPVGASGQVLGISGGLPAWVAKDSGPTGPTGPTGPAGTGLGSGLISGSGSVTHSSVAVTVVHSGTGNYTVHFPGLDTTNVTGVTVTGPMVVSGTQVVCIVARTISIAGLIGLPNANDPSGNYFNVSTAYFDLQFDGMSLSSPTVSTDAAFFFTLNT